MTLPAGTWIRLVPSDGAPCRIGEVVAFVAGAQLTVHRIVARGRRESRHRFLITRGDGSWLCDPPVDQDLVVAVVSAWHDGQGWRPAPGQPVTPPSVAARLFQYALVTALDVHLGLARGLQASANLLDRGLKRLNRSGAAEDRSNLDRFPEPDSAG